MPRPRCDSPRLARCCRGDGRSEEQPGQAAAGGRATCGRAEPREPAASSGGMDVVMWGFHPHRSDGLFCFLCPSLGWNTCCLVFCCWCIAGGCSRREVRGHFNLGVRCSLVLLGVGTAEGQLSCPTPGAEGLLMPGFVHLPSEMSCGCCLLV